MRKIGLSMMLSTLLVTSMFAGDSRVNEIVNQVKKFAGKSGKVIDNYFAYFHYGSGPFDWIAVNKKGTLAAKLEGVNSDGTFRYTILGDPKKLGLYMGIDSNGNLVIKSLDNSELPGTSDGVSDSSTNGVSDSSTGSTHNNGSTDVNNDREDRTPEDDVTSNTGDSENASSVGGKYEKDITKALSIFKDEFGEVNSLVAFLERSIVRENTIIPVEKLINLFDSKSVHEKIGVDLFNDMNDVAMECLSLESVKYGFDGDKEEIKKECNYVKKNSYSYLEGEVLYEEKEYKSLTYRGEYIVSKAPEIILKSYDYENGRDIITTFKNVEIYNYFLSNKKDGENLNFVNIDIDEIGYNGNTVKDYSFSYYDIPRENRESVLYNYEFNNIGVEGMFDIYHECGDDNPPKAHVRYVVDRSTTYEFVFSLDNCGNGFEKVELYRVDDRFDKRVKLKEWSGDEAANFINNYT